MMTTSLLGLSGSLRAGSFSTGILRTLQEQPPVSVDLRIHDLGALPLYNQDLDGSRTPAAVLELREMIADADGLVIVTPEYNYGMPGLLKNALDWASRPHGASALLGKPVIIISGSPAFTGGVRAHAQLHETLLATQSLIVPGPQTVIGEVHKLFDGGRLTDRNTVDFALDAIIRLQRFTQQLSSRLAA
jgi:chromate reductase